MQISLEEKQTLNQVKQAIIKYKKWIIATLVLVIIPLIGYQVYNQIQIKKNKKASAFYQNLTNHIEAKNFTQVTNQAEIITKIPINDAYAKQDRFLLSLAQYQLNQKNKAIETLKPLLKIDVKKYPIYYHLANIQLIRLYLDSQKYNLADNLIIYKKEKSKVFDLIYSYYQVQVDLALKRNKEAKQESARLILLARGNRNFLDLVRTQSLLIP